MKIKKIFENPNKYSKIFKYQKTPKFYLKSDWGTKKYPKFYPNIQNIYFEIFTQNLKLYWKPNTKLKKNIGNTENIFEIP